MPAVHVQRAAKQSKAAGRPVHRPGLLQVLVHRGGPGHAPGGALPASLFPQPSHQQASPAQALRAQAGLPPAQHTQHAQPLQQAPGPGGPTPAGSLPTLEAVRCALHQARTCNAAGVLYVAAMRLLAACTQQLQHCATSWMSWQWHQQPVLTGADQGMPASPLYGPGCEQPGRRSGHPHPWQAADGGACAAGRQPGAWQLGADDQHARRAAAHAAAAASPAGGCAWKPALPGCPWAAAWAASLRTARPGPGPTLHRQPGAQLQTAGQLRPGCPPTRAQRYGARGQGSVQECRGQIPLVASAPCRAAALRTLPGGFLHRQRAHMQVASCRPDPCLSACRGRSCCSSCALARSCPRTWPRPPLPARACQALRSTRRSRRSPSRSPAALPGTAACPGSSRTRLSRPCWPSATPRCTPVREPGRAALAHSVLASRQAAECPSRKAVAEGCRAQLGLRATLLHLQRFNHTLWSKVLCMRPCWPPGA